MKPFALSAVILLPNTLAAKELTADDYPASRAATVEEIKEFCNEGDNPNREARLLSFDSDQEYPFQIITCQQGNVAPYKCSTLSHLIDFEFDIRSLFHSTGRNIEEDNPISSQFTGLFEAYDTHCQDLIY